MQQVSTLHTLLLSLEVSPRFSLRWPASLVRQGWGGRRAGGCPPTRVFSAYHTQKLRVLHVTVTVLRANVYHLPQKKSINVYLFINVYHLPQKKSINVYLFINVYHLPQKKENNSWGTMPKRSVWKTLATISLLFLKEERTLQVPEQEKNGRFTMYLCSFEYYSVFNQIFES